MKNDYSDLPALARDFIDYHVSVRGHSEKTAIGYANDLRVFYRCLVTRRGLDAAGIHTLGADFLTQVDLRELYAYQSFSLDGSTVSASTRCRRTSCIKSYFNYLRRIGVLSQDPTVDLETPKRPASLPAYLEEDECLRLLDNCHGANRVRDKAILTVFLSCGLRVSELVSLNLRDLADDHLTVTGKGSKQRVVYFGEGCRKALDKYLDLRGSDGDTALFLSQKGGRLTVRGVQQMVDKHIELAGLDPERFSTHKLRHTAATLMLRNGVDTRALQEVLGHSNLNTTQIYTHLDNASLRSAAAANPIGSRSL